MPAPANLVHQLSTSTGTGNITLTAVNGKQSFNDAFGTGGTDLFDYFISNQDATEWERGTAHLLDATTLVRDTVIESSNADAAVNFSAGTKDVTNDIPADNQLRTEGGQTLSGTLTLPNTGLHLLDTDASHDLIVAPGSNLTADRTLTITTGDADRALTLGGNATVSQDYSTTGNPQFATIELGAASDTTLSRSSAGVVAVEGSDLAKTEPGVNPQTGTTYTLALTDKGGIVTMSNASANVLTIPTNASVAFPTNTIINVIMLGAGTTSITGATGVTVNGVSAGSGDIQTQYQGVSLLKIATNTWVASGDIGTVA